MLDDERPGNRDRGAQVHVGGAVFRVPDDQEILMAAPQGFLRVHRLDPTITFQVKGWGQVGRDPQLGEVEVRVLDRGTDAVS